MYDDVIVRFNLPLPRPWTFAEAKELLGTPIEGGGEVTGVGPTLDPNIARVTATIPASSPIAKVIVEGGVHGLGGDVEDGDAQMILREQPRLEDDL